LQARTDIAVICIRYKDFSAGTHEATWLHGRTVSSARGVTVYLVPGLTSWQRRAVIRRLRQEASRGFGPALPLPQLAVALGLDRLRTAARIAGAIVRLHPTVALLPSGLVAVLMTLFVVASAGGSGITPGLRDGLSAPAPALAPSATWYACPQLTAAAGGATHHGPARVQRPAQLSVPCSRSSPP
jgi:hypothetical protein